MTNRLPMIGLQKERLPMIGLPDCPVIGLPDCPADRLTNDCPVIGLTEKIAHDRLKKIVYLIQFETM